MQSKMLLEDINDIEEKMGDITISEPTNFRIAYDKLKDSLGKNFDFSISNGAIFLLLFLISHTFLKKSRNKFISNRDS